MNKKAQSNVLMNNISRLILLAIFIAGIFAVIWQQSNGAGVWEDYYAKEIVKSIDLAKQGDEVTLDVQKGTEIAFKNGVGKSEIFNFNNVNNEVCVKLSAGRSTCFNYFNDVDITDPNVELGVPINVLHFSVKESVK